MSLSPSVRRSRSTIQAAVMVAIAALLFFVFHKSLLPACIAGLAILTLIGGWFIPPVFEAFEGIGRFLTKSVTLILTWGLLVPFFYLFFLPARIILTLRKVDPMTRRWEKDAASYWVNRQPVTDMHHYSRQY